jgi:hypothetical protein
MRKGTYLLQEKSLYYRVIVSYIFFNSITYIFEHVVVEQNQRLTQQVDSLHGEHMGSRVRIPRSLRTDASSARFGLFPSCAWLPPIFPPYAQFNFGSVVE